MADSQVLICPGCQSSFDWMAALDRCPVCGGAHLVRRLGETECRDCGSVRQPAGGGSAVGGLGTGAGAGPGPDRGSAGSPGSGGDGSADGGLRSPAAAPGLAEEVERALEKVLGRTRGTARIG
jgi:hypothetical protein